MSSASKSCSCLQCVNISGTRPHCSSQNRHLKVEVSASLTSSRISPTELAVSESVSDMAVHSTQISGESSQDMGRFVCRISVRAILLCFGRMSKVSFVCGELRGWLLVPSVNFLQQALPHSLLLHDLAASDSPLLHSCSIFHIMITQQKMVLCT